MRFCFPPLVATLALAATAPAQFTLSELFVDAPGTDEGQEFVEIRGAANAALTGYFLLVIEGDGTGAGVVDAAINLGTYSTGGNGLLLIRDTSAVLSPPPDAATSVVVFNFTPDIENGTNTFVLGFGTAPAVTTDLDANNDGILDNGIPGFTTVDTVGTTDGGASDFQYAAQLGGTNHGNGNAFTPDVLYRIYDGAGNPICWTVGDVLAASVTGPYTFDFATNRAQGGLGAGYGPQGLSPGNLNGSIDLCTPTYGVSSLNGGSQALTLHAGAANAGKLYLVVGSFAGTTPGIPITPTVTLALNFDAYLQFTLGTFNTPVLSPSIGTLDGQGRATCTFTLPGGGILPVGATVDHAALVIDMSTFRFVLGSTPARVVVQA